MIAPQARQTQTATTGLRGPGRTCWKMADIAGYAATAAFAVAGLSLVFSALRFYHASKVTPDRAWPRST